MSFQKIAGVIGVACLSMLGAYADAVAQPYPNKPVRIIVPWPPGGSTDTIGRLLGQRMTPLLGQNVVIDNRAGGSGVIGIELATRDARRLFAGDCRVGARGAHHHACPSAL